MLSRFLAVIMGDKTPNFGPHVERLSKLWWALFEIEDKMGLGVEVVMDGDLYVLSLIERGEKMEIGRANTKDELRLILEDAYSTIFMRTMMRHVDG